MRARENGSLLFLLVFRLFVAGIVVGMGPYFILTAHPNHDIAVPAGLAIGLGGLMIAFGAVVYLRCVWDFAFDGEGMAPGHLIARGVYALMRNPMYSGLLVILAGEALWSRSARLLGCAAVIGVCLHLLVTVWEEPALAKALGNSYIQYRRDVPRWVPRISRTR